ncbi:DUF373 family protein [Stetteria hydrogenophila]
MRREAAQRRALVVVIDLDDDIAEAGFTTPIIGEENVLRVAIEFALSKPEDSDANAIFAGLQLYRRLVSQGVPAEIAIVSGVRDDTVEAQIRVRNQVKSIVESLGGNVELYLVSDGDEDLLALEALREVAPIVAVKRVVVEQHLGLEGVFILILRYAKKAFLDVRFSKYFLGVPGLILATWATLSLAGYADVFYKVAMLILGLAMIVKGFNLEVEIEGFFSELVNRPPLMLAGSIVLIIFALASAVSAYYASTASSALQALAIIMKNSVPLLAAGMIAYVVISRILYKISNSDFDLHKDLAIIVLAGFMALAFNSLGNRLEGILYNASSEAIVDAILGSNFVEAAIIGAGLAGIIELAGKYLKGKRRSQYKDPEDS